MEFQEYFESKILPTLDKNEIIDMDIKDINLTNADLSNADLRDADLRNANLTGAGLTNADLSFADLRNVNLTGADLTKADLTGANLSHAKLRNVNLTKADLTGANLSFANLTISNLSNVNLRNADLTNAYSSFADLRNANLRNADLTGANLRNANLRNANLTGALLRNADLRNADLRNANLTGALLRNADLRNADLSNADLTGANFMEFEEYFESKILPILDTNSLEIIDSKVKNLELKSVANLFKKFILKKEYEYAAYIIYGGRLYNWKNYSLYKYIESKYLEYFNFDRLLLASQYLCKEMILDDKNLIEDSSIQNIEIILNNPILEYVLLESPELIDIMSDYLIIDKRFNGLYKAGKIEIERLAIINIIDNLNSDNIKLLPYLTRDMLINHYNCSRKNLDTKTQKILHKVIKLFRIKLPKVRTKNRKHDIKGFKIADLLTAIDLKFN